MSGAAPSTLVPLASAPSLRSVDLENQRRNVCRGIENLTRPAVESSRRLEHRLDSRPMMRHASRHIEGHDVLARRGARLVAQRHGPRLNDGPQRLLEALTRENGVPSDRQPARHRRQQRRRTITPVCSTPVHADRADGGVRRFCNPHRSSSDIRPESKPIRMPDRQGDELSMNGRDLLAIRARSRESRHEHSPTRVRPAPPDRPRPDRQWGANTPSGNSLPRATRSDGRTAERRGTGRHCANRERRPNSAARVPRDRGVWRRFEVANGRARRAAMDEGPGLTHRRS